MSNKTDKTKSTPRPRIRYACKPELQKLIDTVNLFPQTDKWIVVNKPLPLFPPILAPGQTTSPEYEKKKKEWQEEMARAGLDLIKTIRNQIGDAAHNQVIFAEELIKVGMLAKKIDDASDNAKKALENYKNTKDISFKNEAILLVKQLPEFDNEFHEYCANVSHLWFERYDLIKRLKKFLTNLAFIARNFENAEKKINSFPVLDLNELFTKLYVDENGILQRQENKLLEWVIGIDIRRLKQCSICRNIFWANRADRQCCTKKCADVNNQRESRKNKQISGELYKKAAKTKKST